MAKSPKPRARPKVDSKWRSLLDRASAQSGIPSIAKDSEAMELIGAHVATLPTQHRLFRADCREIDFIEDQSVHLVLTSPPYWTLKRARTSPLGKR